jgi:uncharacterized membrane protein
MKRGVAAALAVAGIAYPFAVHAALGRVSAAWLALPLALLWLARGLTADAARPGARLLPAVAVAFCLVLAVSNSQDWLRWYPVLVNGMMLAIFGASLRRGRPVIEQLARLRHPDLPPEGVRYTRNVTRVWWTLELVDRLQRRRELCADGPAAGGRMAAAPRRRQGGVTHGLDRSRAAAAARPA